MSEEKSFINIVLAADKNYSNIMGVTMVSVLYNLNKNTFARFFLLTEDFSDDDINKLNKIKKIYPCEISNIDVKEYMKIFDFVEQKSFRNSWITKSCLYRLLMFKYLPDDVQECFYIDSDIIADGDISKIKLPEDKLFAAVPECITMQFRRGVLAHWNTIPEFSNFDKDPLKYTHVGAGFYLANIKKAKELDVFEQMVTLFKKYPNLPYADQDVLNAIFGQKYHEFMYYLPPEYNVFADADYSIEFNNTPFSNEVIQQAVKNPVIIHYGGERKPWRNSYCRPFFHKWWFYYLKSPWKVDCISKYTILMAKKYGIRLRYMIFSRTIRYINNERFKVYTIFGIKIKIKSKIINSHKH